MALEKTIDEYGAYQLKAVPVSMRQQRQFISLDDNLLDVMWTATSAEREKRALPVRIPLLKGLIGHRVFVIRKTDVERFAQLDRLEDLARLTAVQGLAWPDVDILRNAGLKVENLVWRKSLYKMVSSGIVDYYPRSVLEVLDEWKSEFEPDLVIEQKHLLIYPSAMYFFVRRENAQLASRLSLGLTKAIEDGTFDRLFLAEPSHQKALSTFLNEKRRVHFINNPLLPEATPLEDESLWYTSYQSTEKP